MAKYSNGLEDNLDIRGSSVIVLEKRYLKKDDSGEINETGEDMYRRVARDIACADAFYLNGLKEKVNRDTPTGKLYEIASEDMRIEKRAEEFYEIMTKGYFTPNSPTLMNAGRDLQQLAACFVLPVLDSIEDIFDALKYTAMIHKSGGGTGFSFSRLRPAGNQVKSTSGVASGPVSFMKVFDAATEQVKQGGTRRGANMGILRVDHPDIMEFIYSKDKGGINNFNISVAATDEFMQAVKEGRNYDLINPRDGAKASEINAEEVYSKLVHQAWKTGDPGIIFIDRINQFNPTPDLGQMESTNPCGEQPLLPYEACDLGAVNLGKMTKNGKLDEILLEKTVCSGVRFLDNVIDRSKYPIPQITEMVLGNRKIGLGIMGFADYLVKKGISYNSPEAIDEAEKVMKKINDVSKDESRRLAKERGAFPNFDKSIFKDEEPIRNATTTTIAPTGTISIINGNASSGIESIYALVVKRKVKDSIGVNLIEVNRGLEEFLEENNLYDEGTLLAIAEEPNLEGILMPLKIKEEIKKLFPTAHDIPSEQHIRIQAAFQKYTDNAVSKTVNLHKDASESEVRKIYDLAYELGCKGVTIYRDGTKEGQILTTGDTDSRKKKLEALAGKDFMVIPFRGRDLKNVQGLQGVTYEIETGCGPLFVTMNYDELGLVESFTNMNPSGGCAAAQTATQGILSSFNFHRGVEPKRIAKHLGAIRCPEYDINRVTKTNRMSCPQALAEAINLFEKDYQKIKEGYKGTFLKKGFDINAPKTEEDIENSVEPKNNNRGKNVIDKIFCSECGSELSFEGGCKGGICHSCGFSKC